MKYSFMLKTILLFLFIAYSVVPTQASEIPRSGLFGVWVATSYDCEYPQQIGEPKLRMNLKYCFNSTTAYPELHPDSRFDSADGGGSYFIVDDNILVINTGVPHGIKTYQITSISKNEMVWYERATRVVLKRIANNWNGKAPRIRPIEIEVKYAKPLRAASVEK